MAGRKSKYSSNEKIDVKKTWSVAIYIRLSQEDLDNGEERKESNSVTSQRTLINEFIEEHDDLIVYDTYVDDGYTGTDFNRPSFQRLLEDMKKGNVNCIIVKDLSRLGRNYIEVGNYIEQVFPLFNIRFIAINDSVDSFKNPASTNTILVPFKNLINDEYARDTSIKIRTALNGKKKKGEFIGAFPSYGYIKSPKDKHKLIIDNSVVDIVRKIFDWNVNEGLGKIAICHKLNDLGILNPTGHKKLELGQNYKNFGIQDNTYTWTPSTIRNILSNEIYIGNTVQGKRRAKSYKIHKVEAVEEEEWIRVENTHEPIIDKETFSKAQEMRKRDTRVQNTGNLSIWAGILKCADCGRAMHKKYSKNKKGIIYEYYICGTYRKKSNKLCTKHTIKTKDLETAVLNAIKLHVNFLINIENLLEQIKSVGATIDRPQIAENKMIEQKQNEISKISNLKRCLYEDWKNEYITKDEYLEYKKKYEKDIERLKEIIINMESHKEKQKELTSQKNLWIENFKAHKNITELDRDIITELIDYIDVHEDKKITIHFKFMNECGDKIHQGGGVAAPIASQVLGEVLPYLDVIKSKEEQTNSVTVPNVMDMSLKEAKKVLKEIGLEYDIQSNTEEYDIENAVILDQLPKQGITIQEGTKIILYID